MCSHCWNKLIAISWALAAAGVLACAGALLDTFIPRGSVLGFLAWTVVLGVIIIGTVVGYTWVCDKCEDYVNGPRDRLPINGSKSQHNDGVNPGTLANLRPAVPKVLGDARSASDARQPLSLSDRYVPAVRCSARKDATAASMWHGQ